MKSSNTAKYTFLYLISLLSLIFTVIAVGNVIFQLINKHIVDVVHAYRSTYSADALKFAISSLLIAAPVYYYSAANINKSLFSGKLEKDAAVRRWLTYLIIFVCGVVVVGWLIAIVYSILDGDLTLKFSLKTLTVLIIAAIVGSYYYRDIKKEKIQDIKDPIIRKYFYSTLCIVVIVFLSGILFVESPHETRLRKIDQLTISKLDNIDRAINDYFEDNEQLPDYLEELHKEVVYLHSDGIEGVINGEVFEYRVLEEQKYRICADFNLATEEINKDMPKEYYEERWKHKAGKECFIKKINKNIKIDILRKEMPVRDPIMIK